MEVERNWDSGGQGREGDNVEERQILTSMLSLGSTSWHGVELVVMVTIPVG